MKNALLDIRDLFMGFPVPKTKQKICAVNGVSLHIEKGRTLGIVGESGSGKSLTSLSVMRLLPETGRIFSGDIQFCGQDLTTLKEKDMYQIRGKQISMIFQDPMTALDPVYKIGYQIIETLRNHNRDMTKKEAYERSLSLLRSVGMPHPENIMQVYPHELSGGMCQRVMIAIALACDPKLLIADEPTTALDVTIQAQIMDLLKHLKAEREMSIMLITHDLGVVADIADYVVVMYAGEIVEEGEKEAIFRFPSHPYTRGLMASIPKINNDSEKELYCISGTVPSLREMPDGCRFRTRCPHADSQCAQSPAWRQVGDDHWLRCCKVEKENGEVPGYVR